MSSHINKLFENLEDRLNLYNIENNIIKKNIKKSLNNLNELNLGFIEKDNIGNKKKFLFQLHPKKTKEWSFSSPTRYYRSLEKNIIPLTFLSDKISDQITQSYTIEIKDFNKLDKKVNNLKNDQLKNSLNIFLKAYNERSK